jgi:hypothetical protein
MADPPNGLESLIQAAQKNPEGFGGQQPPKALLKMMDIFQQSGIMDSMQQLATDFKSQLQSGASDSGSQKISPEMLDKMQTMVTDPNFQQKIKNLKDNPELQKTMREFASQMRDFMPKSAGPQPDLS